MMDGVMDKAFNQEFVRRQLRLWVGTKHKTGNIFHLLIYVINIVKIYLWREGI